MGLPRPAQRAGLVTNVVGGNILATSGGFKEAKGRGADIIIIIIFQQKFNCINSLHPSRLQLTTARSESWNRRMFE